MCAFHSIPFSVPSHWITFSPLPKSSKNTLSGKNIQWVSVMSNRWFSVFSSLPLYTWPGDQGDLVHLCTLPTPILLEPAHPPLAASPGFQWHSPSFQKAWAMPNFWSTCQGQFTVVPDSREVFPSRLSAGHLGKTASSTPFSRECLSYTLTLQSSPLSSCTVSALGHL